MIPQLRSEEESSSSRNRSSSMIPQFRSEEDTELARLSSQVREQDMRIRQLEKRPNRSSQMASIGTQTSRDDFQRHLGTGGTTYGRLEERPPDSRYNRYSLWSEP